MVFSDNHIYIYSHPHSSSVPKLNINQLICEIVLTGANVIYGITFSYPLYFRTTDVVTHFFYSSVIFLSGHSIPLDLDPSYSSFPLYHILIAESKKIINLPLQETLFLITCPIFLLAILFAYKIFYLVSGNKQVSILGCLFFSMSSIVLNRGIEMTPSVAAAVGFVILVYLLVKAGGRRVEQRQTFLGLAIIVSLMIILVHQVSIFMIVALLAVFILSENINGCNKYFSNYYFLALIGTLTSAYWIYYSPRFLNQIIRDRVENINLEARHVELSNPLIDPTSAALIFVHDNIFLSLVTVFAVTGIFYMVWRQKPKYLAVVGIFLLFTLALYLPTPLSTLNFFSSLLRVDRFLILLSPFMAFAMSYGYILIFNVSKKYIKKKFLLESIFIFIVLVFLVFSIPSVILTESSETRSFFSAEELDGFGFVVNNVPYGSTLVSDYHSVRFFVQRFFSLTDELHLPYFDSRMLEKFDDSPSAGGYSIIREKMFNDYSLPIGSINALYTYYPTKDNRITLSYYLEKIDKIYDSGIISIGC